MSPMREVYLTFDIEDFINERSIKSLKKILELLEKYKLTGLFFITGYMAEKISSYEDILDLLQEHMIGYHSSSHSIIPIIPMFTDVEDYQEAVEISYERETSHITPSDGEVEGEGGIKLLRDIFPEKEIVSFRAPGHSWSPPHLDALKKLGIRFDFSANISSNPVFYDGIVFYNVPIERNVLQIGASLIRRQTTILRWHEHVFVNFPLSGVIKKNSDVLQKSEPKPSNIVKKEFDKFEQMLNRLSMLENLNLVENQRRLKTTKNALKKVDIQKVYDSARWWPEWRYNYKPKFLYSHLLKFSEKVK